ncbi:helix-turn-helix transcriptional regulator [Methylobacterium sp. WL69]|uniref:helix-turn-helix domain-containing protein n=1 Tax=Methylobacterium sp. WL69 TaxID=2603893 RepID=UPI0011C76424|nr:helix-turn-helix transcriptional regulator [Methylobacterium sp. WL69]TXM69026.1 helix-turn-helix transcriptional regulator [Methylobacterium sp. WL69]
MEIFAIRLRARAEELGIAHAEAARRAGLSERRYSHYVNGIREPDLATLVRIAGALRTTPDWLLGVAEPGQPSPRSVLLDRLNSAADALIDEILEIVVVQSEALAAKHRPRVLSE